MAQIIRKQAQNIVHNDTVIYNCDVYTILVADWSEECNSLIKLKMIKAGSHSTRTVEVAQWEMIEVLDLYA